MEIFRPNAAGAREEEAVVEGAMMQTIGIGVTTTTTTISSSSSRRSNRRLEHLRKRWLQPSEFVGIEMETTKIRVGVWIESV